MNLPEDQDPLWDLLAQSPPPSPSPRFVSKTTRAVRELAQGHDGSGLPRWIAWLRPSETRSPWGLPLALGATAALAITVVLWQSDAPDGAGELAVTEVITEIEAFDPATEIEAVEHLAQLMAITDPDSLSDELFADLLF